MNARQKAKSILASVLVTVALCAPIMVFSTQSDPVDAELGFEILENGSLVMCPDGSVQLLVNVAVDQAINCRGASFRLSYNQDYLTPSYIVDTTIGSNTYKANTPIETGVQGLADNDYFFQEDKDLFGLTDGGGNPIAVMKQKVTTWVGYVQQTHYYSQLDTNDGAINMTLWFDNQVIAKALDTNNDNKPDSEGAGKLTRLHGIDPSISQDEYVYVFNKQDYQPRIPAYVATDQTPGKVVLGQLSFRVNKDRLAEVIDLFDGMDHRCNYSFTASPNRPEADLTLPDGSKGGKTFLLDTKQSEATGGDNWQISYYYGNPGDRTTTQYAPKKGTNVQERYTYNFKKDLIVDVQLTNPDFEINAYQNYTAGNTGDLRISMGRYANMVTVTYADGTKANEPFPWGQTNTTKPNGYTAQYIEKTNLDPDKTWPEMTRSAITKYDPTANVANPTVGTDYIFTQKYQQYKTYTNSDGETVYKKDGSGNYEVDYEFPVPVVGHMRVTPITVVRVTADDMERSYPVTTVTRDIKKANDLGLPTQARIITDIVPGNVSLVTPIKGWKPVRSDSTWPNGDMNTLHATSATAAAGYAVWPEPTKNADVSAAQAGDTAGKFIGHYHFETSQADHATKEDILRVDIQATFPWLTVPKESYDLGQARRSIVKASSYLDSADYTVDYISTVTGTTRTGYSPEVMSQPTLTLRARKNGGGLTANSVFRVWLPNGMELGTGQNAGGVTVAENWFADPANNTNNNSGTVPAGHYNGFYYTDSATGGGRALIMNPADPTQPATTGSHNYYNSERETLRRYINLGGWYRVAICEDPSTGAWTEPIPVYVPPRPNEYQESKIYNFVAENQGLFNWPGGVNATMYYPRGDYNALAPNLNETNYNSVSAADHLKHIGLPLYTYTSGSSRVVTNAIADAANVFVGNNPYALKDGVERYSESYGVRTTYDGQTGAQPGVIYNVRVADDVTDKDADWNAPLTPGQAGSEKTNATVGGEDVTRYGATPLKNEYMVTGYGYVYQQNGKTTGNASYNNNPKQATLRTQLDAPEAQVEKITLTSTADNGITREPPGTKANNVTLVTYDTVREGYTIRQDHLLTINNVGDVDIYGLDIDSLIDGYPLSDGGGGHFIITQAPASFLPAGTSTNFILTYVYDLRANHNPNRDLHYRDTLYITSTSHPDAIHGGTNQNNPAADGSYDYLLDFDAELTVSPDPLRKVTVIYRPTDGSMGTAGLIIGEQGSGSGVTMNTAAASSTYTQGNLVYVEAQKLDEYAIRSVTMEYNGTTHTLYSFNGTTTVQTGKYRPGVTVSGHTIYGTATLADGTEVFVFNMPDYDVTVYVDFYEPTYSKLRLDGLVDFSDPDTLDLVRGYKDPNDAYEPTDPGHIYQVWQKQFTDAEKAYAPTWSAAHGSPGGDYYLMTVGKTIPASQGGNVYNSSNPHYLVVIDNEDDFSQIKAMLRKVKVDHDWRDEDPTYASDPPKHNKDINTKMVMNLYYDDDNTTHGHQVGDKFDENIHETVYNQDVGYGPYNSAGQNKRNDGYTGDPTYHITADWKFSGRAGFESPEPGTSAYVDIAISAPDEMTGQTVTRHYFVEIHRRTDEPMVQLHYGNSPYGMIMNESKFVSDTTRDAAKAGFVGRNYTFRGATHDVLPDAVSRNHLDLVTYWREAWVRNKGVFEPESLTGFYQKRDKDGNLMYEDSAGNSVKPNADGSVPADFRGVYVPDPDIYDEKENLDLHDYAFFAILGQDMWEPGVKWAKDSTGRMVDLKTIHARVLDLNGTDGVTLLDTTKTLQVERFKGDPNDKPVIDLGVAGQWLTDVYTAGLGTVNPDWGVTQWPIQTTLTTDSDGNETASHTVIEDIRPGRYLIEYSYEDFDGTLLTTTRPFVILRRVGDVNVDGERTAIRGNLGGFLQSDEYHIEDRVTRDPLGYEAGGWNATTKVQTVYPWSNIFKYRVTDVNNDRNINNIDANQVAANVKANGGWLQFYHPYDYGHPGPLITPGP